jgi:hypothetical protein
MTSIQPVAFPLNLGTANKISITLSASTSDSGANIVYSLLDTSVTPFKRLATGRYDITEEQFTDHGNDKVWIDNYVADQLGITFIVE